MPRSGHSSTLPKHHPIMLMSGHGRGCLVLVAVAHRHRWDRCGGVEAAADEADDESSNVFQLAGAIEPAKNGRLAAEVANQGAGDLEGGGVVAAHGDRAERLGG
jgi:hypothetical protein